LAPIISVRGLGKRYTLGARTPQGSLRDLLGSLVSRGAAHPGSNGSAPTVWALRHVDFDVQPGEVMGVIGANGAGKSTLLKVLSRISQPSEGEARLGGRVGSLLDVGTGFHPELTGRENIYMSGAVLGMAARDIANRFDAIVSFAEVDRFIDTPVKHYSSGMYLRLAFSVAAHLSADILLMDEVLAVGDAAFQKKCLGKMEDASSGGRTVLFVSHNLVAVQSLCDRVLWLDRGRVEAVGPVGEVVPAYLQRQLNGTSVAEEHWPDSQPAPGNEVARLRRISVGSALGAGSAITMDSPVNIDVEYENLVPNAVLDVALHIITEQETIAFATWSSSDDRWRERRLEPGTYRATCRIPGQLLNSGRHRFRVFVVRDLATLQFHYDSRVTFDVIDTRTRGTGWHGKEPGAVQPRLEWTTRRIERPHLASAEPAAS
jgi:lipopolysaccharide transport system ATP-binding protein